MYFHFGCVKLKRICDYLVFFDPFVQHLFDSVVKVENNTSHYQQFSAKVVALNLEKHCIEVFLSPLILLVCHCILGAHCFLVFNSLFLSVSCILWYFYPQGKEPLYMN